MPTVDVPEDQPIEVTVGAPTFATGVGGIDGITEARAVELDAQTLAAAKAYADEIDTVSFEYVDDGDADAVAQAKAYTDTALVEVTANAKSYTDDAIAGIDFPDTGVPEATIDAKDQAILTQAKAHADAKPNPDVTKAYVDSGLSEKSNTGHSHSFDSITERPTAYPPSTHQHSASDTTSGVFPPARLGTGTANGSSFLSGDGTFKVPPGATNAQIEAAVNSYLAANPPAPSGNLLGPGRPDLPSGTGMAAAIASAPVGTTYSSTDGAGVGAWGWRKRTAGNTGTWTVFDGDTGWQNITTLLDSTTGPIDKGMGGSYMKIRRTAESVWMDCRFLKSGTGVVMFDVPDGWKHSSPDGAKGVLIPTDGGLNAGKMQYRGGSGGFEWKPQNTGHGFGLFSYLSDRFWPTTLV